MCEQPLAMVLLLRKEVKLKNNNMALKKTILIP